MIELSKVLQVQGARIGWKIYVKNTRYIYVKLYMLIMSLGVGISEDEMVTFGNEKVHQADSFTYLVSIISKDGGSSEYVKSRIAKSQGIFHS